jgi:ABC-type phosphate transport system substrate-binding protein
MKPRLPLHFADSTGLWLARRAFLRAMLGALGVAVFERKTFADARSDGFIIVVNPQNPAGSAERELLADFFLKRVSRWSDGELVRPVDLRPDAAARQAFSKVVIRRSVSAVRNYWQQRIFAGRDVPPAELDSDEAVVRYVARYRGAIGYVSPAASIADVKPFSVR